MFDYSRGHLTAAWDHTAALLCLIANAHRDPKTKPRTPEDFHPLRVKKRRGGLQRSQVAGMRPLVEAMRRRMGAK